MKLPRIVQIAPYYPPHMGGMENVVSAIANGLAAKGNDVDVITTRIPGGAARSTTKQLPGTLNVTRLGVFEFAHTPFAPGALRALRKTPRNAIFHIHLGVAGLPELAIIIAKLRHIPTVLHFHLDTDPSGWLGKLILRPYQHTLYKLFLRAGDDVVVFSEHQARLVSDKYGIKRERISIIPNGVAEEFFSATTPRIPTGELQLLYVGRLAVQKRVERLIEALSLAKAPLSLRIVGDGEDQNMLEELTEKLGLKNVTFAGKKTGKALIAEYKRADALVMPSDKEGMSLVMLEAMAGGLPVIGSDVVGIREHLAGIGMLVKDPSPQTFAHALDEFYGHRQELIPRYSAAGRDVARQHSWPRLCTELEKLYRKLDNGGA